MKIKGLETVLSEERAERQSEK
ncbi:hypothetical protein VIBNISO65_980024 [Vibrio nigripulchritudo SO65]|nr:hypothetical protein VIBNISO65_980024 [Vibrio nigripulchritudo SO65]